MTLCLLTWLIFVVWVVFGFYRSRADQPALGYHGVIAVLLFLIIWHTCGFVIRG